MTREATSDLPRAITIPDELLAAAYAHARATFPAECCGYFVGPRDGDAVAAIVACRNAQEDGEHPTHPERTAETGFVIAGAELFTFARGFACDTPPRIVYHSHTNGRAYFSAVDHENAIVHGHPAYPVQHLVIGVTGDGLTECAQFAWSAHVADFVEVARWNARCYSAREGI